MTPITEHFSQEELGVKGCADRLIGNASLLCSTIMEPIRAHYGTPVRVHCGYRDTGHNARVGGKPSSWHLFDGSHSAIDFDIPGQGTEAVFNWIRLQSKLPFDKVILERNKNGAAACIHLQFDAVDNRRLAYTGSTGAAFDYVPVEVA